MCPITIDRGGKQTHVRRRGAASKGTFLVAIAILNLLLAVGAGAATLILSDVSSDPDPAVLDATLDFEVLGSTLLLKVTNDTTAPNTYNMNSVYFNAASSVTGLTLVSAVSSMEGNITAWWSLLPSESADGFGTYDFLLRDGTGESNPNQIAPQEIMTFELSISGTGPFSADDFTTKLSTIPPGETPGFAAAKFVNGPGGDGGFGANISGAVECVGSGTPCDDEDACTTNDTCQNGVCVGGPPLGCDDGNVCTDDSCNPATGCVNTNNTAPCSDGNACTNGDVCSGGSCVAGPPLGCDDGNVCTDDSCNPATGCVNTNNTAPCSDGNICTTGDACSGGSCVGGPPPNCDDGEVCTDDSCHPSTGCVNTNNTASCDDGDPLTTGDTCSGGVCQGVSATSLCSGGVGALCGNGVIDPGEDCEPPDDMYCCACRTVQILGTDGTETIDIVAEGYPGGAVVNARGGADTVIGSEAADVICGGSGPDTIFGNGGDDIIWGNDGADRIFGGEGADDLNGNQGSDDLSGELGDDNLCGEGEADQLSGGPGNDVLQGGDSADSMNGDDGNDLLIGGQGPDILHGGEGDDDVFGDSQADTLHGEGGNDLLVGGTENDTLHGGTGDDILDGGPGLRDKLFGDEDNDTLDGGDGRYDLCDGGTGVDSATAECEKQIDIP